MNRLLAFFMMAVLSVFAMDTLWADAQLDVVLSSDEIVVDQTTRFKVEVQWPKAEANYTFAFPHLDLENLTIEKWGESQETFLEDDQEWIRKTFSILLKPKHIGTAKITGFALPYLDTETHAGGRFTIAEQVITVRQIPLRISMWHILYFLPIPIALFLLWLLARSRKKKLEESPQGLSKEEEMIYRFHELRETRLGKNPKNLLHEMSSLLRHYVVDRYQLASDTATEKEILEQLTSRQIPREEIKDLQRLFERVHEAKFTGVGLSEEEFERLFSNMIQYFQRKKVVGNP